MKKADIWKHVDKATSEAYKQAEELGRWILEVKLDLMGQSHFGNDSVLEDIAQYFVKGLFSGKEMPEETELVVKVSTGTIDHPVQTNAPVQDCSYVDSQVEQAMDEPPSELLNQPKRYRKLKMRAIDEEKQAIENSSSA